MSNTSCDKSLQECIGNRYNINLLFLLILFIFIVKGIDYNIIPYEVVDKLGVNEYISNIKNYANN